jgi:hypothetical protein
MHKPSILVLGLVVFGLTTGQASAEWLSWLTSKHKCYVTLKCKQYNAFSPYCCDDVPADVIAAGQGHPWWRSAVFAAGVSGECLTDLPSSAPLGENMVWEGPASPPTAGMPLYSGPPLNSNPAGITSVPDQARPYAAPNTLAPPNAVPSYSPTFLRYAPLNNLGTPGK